MNTIWLPILVSSCLALALVLAGLSLAFLGLITHKNSKRTTVLAASLAAAVALWLAQRSHLFIENSALDSVALLCVLWFGCFLLFWTGVIGGIKMTNHHHHDFGESSILSMQYLESRMVEQSPGSDDADFPPTVFDATSEHKD